jgi:hypothetical protein
MTDDSDSKRLPRELVWDGAHVSELAVTAIADGQEGILQRDALEHAEACEWCAGRLGRAALLSAAVGQAVVHARSAHTSSRAPARASARPWSALLVGVVVAVLAALPSLPHLTTTVLDALAFGRAFSTHGVPVLVRGGFELANREGASRALTLATVVSSALLVMMGWAIARTRSRVSSERSVS